jgi:hypothetical protein
MHASETTADQIAIGLGFPANQRRTLLRYLEELCTPTGTPPYVSRTRRDRKQYYRLSPDYWDRLKRAVKSREEREARRSGEF